MEPIDRFATELSTFEAHVQTWLAIGQEGKWFCVKGGTFVGPFDSHGAAWEGGIREFSSPGFLVRQVVRNRQPRSLSHVRWNSSEAENG